MSEHCKNCAAPLSGDFCSQCGQSAAEFDLPVGEFAKELAAETLSLDSRLRVTLKTLFFKPGAVPLEYLEGHRARFVPPVRLYLFASFAMFLLLALGSGLTVNNVRVNGAPVADAEADSVATEVEATVDVAPADVDSLPAGDGSFGSRMGARLTEGINRVSEDTSAFTQDFLNRLTRALFLLLPAFALLLKLAYRRRLYVHHLVFAMYLHSFTFLIVAFVAVPDTMGLTTLGKWISVLLLWIPVYFFLGMRRFYREGWMKTAAKFTGISAIYGLLSMATWIAILVLSLLSA